jgi:hypothetical protein
VEAIARLGNALGGGVKMAVDLARMGVGLPPTQTGFSVALDLAAQSTAQEVCRPAHQCAELHCTHRDGDEERRLDELLDPERMTKGIGVIGDRELMVRSHEFHTY